MKPNDYFYGISIDYINRDDLERLFGWGYFKYYEDALDVKEWDANGDNSVDAEDILKMTNDIMYPSFILNKSVTDINGDGVINIADIIALINILCK